MPISNFFGFDLVQRDADGKVSPLVNEDVSVYDVTNATSLTDIQTDDFGRIPTQEIDVEPDSIIEFSVSGYSTTLQRTTAADANAALGFELALVVEDLYSFDTFNAVDYAVWLVNEDDPDYQPKFLGRVPAGQPIVIPHDLLVDGENIALYKIGYDEKNVPSALGLNEAIKVSVNLIAVAQDIISGDSENVLSSDAQQVVSIN